MHRWFKRFFGKEKPTKNPEEWTAFRLVKEIPISGNAFISQAATANGGEEAIREHQGLINWNSSTAICSIYFRQSKAEVVGVTLRLAIPSSGTSTLRLSLVEVNGQPATGQDFQVDILSDEGGEFQNVRVANFDVPQGGYLKFHLTGINRTGPFYAIVSHLLLSHEDTNNEIVFNSTEESYFGRRGPSVHFRYPVPTGEYSVEYFYNEVTVPPGSDAVGLYAMATGFSGGYFGIQVNGPVERRVLFSIWSEYDTEDPGQIPEEYKVRLVRKGKGVVVGEFGNEGAGAQSFSKFYWRAGSTYKFLVRAVPLDADNTLYTAWFRRPEEDADWQLVTSFRKPKVSIYLKDLYSFLENFIPENGHLERRAHFGNQWVRDSGGQWHELTQAVFTGDATSRMGRRDFAGGVVEKEDGGDHFYLRHCGFFSDFVATDQNFLRTSTGIPPDVDVENLP